MICRNPVLDELEEILRLRDNLFGLRMGCHSGVIVVDYIALAPAGFKEVEVTGSRSTKRQPGRFKCEPVMTRYARQLKACAHYGHFRGLQRSVVGGCEATVVRELLDCRVLKIAGDDRPQLV